MVPLTFVKLQLAIGLKIIWQSPGALKVTCLEAIKSVRDMEQNMKQNKNPSKAELSVLEDMKDFRKFLNGVYLQCKQREVDGL